MLATGGCGRLYTHTTIRRWLPGTESLAAESGVDIKNMEFMQFHPTTLNTTRRCGRSSSRKRCWARGVRSEIISARPFVRLRRAALELAPRDIVARAIEAEMKNVALGACILTSPILRKIISKHEFPTIYERLRTIQLEIEKDWIPVVPAQHYSCGGVTTDSARSHVDSRPLRVRRSCVHRSSRRQPPGQQQPARSARFFEERGRVQCKEPTTTADVTEARWHTHQAISENEAVRLRRAIQHDDRARRDRSHQRRARRSRDGNQHRDGGIRGPTARAVLHLSARNPQLNRYRRHRGGGGAAPNGERASITIRTRLYYNRASARTVAGPLP